MITVIEKSLLAICGVRPTPRFTRAGHMWVWSRGNAGYGADVVGGCKELSAGGDACL
jgi:hypothetical protein